MQDEYINAPGAELITGAGGGKGGGSAHTPQEAQNTLRSSAIARIVEVVSEGPIEGLAGGARGIYINDTPFLNEDGSGNFIRSTYDYRVGLPTQDYMPGFSAVETEIPVNTAVTEFTNDIARTVSAANIDAVMVTIQLPAGLSAQVMDGDNIGDLNGSSVSFSFQKRLGTGTWEDAGTFSIDGKTTAPYEASYRVQRPGSSGQWSVRVHRNSPDPSASVHNQIVFARMTEIQEIHVSYPDAAVVGLAVDAQTVGNTIPKRSYLVKGVLIKVPNNYDPVAKTYSGAWDGTFVNTVVACDNPAWVLYDMLTNTRYGASVDPTDIDKFSFYDAAVYCDQTLSITDANGSPATVPRFTFNARIADRPQMTELIKNVAGMMNANLIYWNGKWTLIQDRPSSPVKLITKANVVDGQFTYKSSGLYERHTAVNISYTDRTDRFLPRVVTIEDSTGMDRYGYNSLDLAAFGATTQNQAIRAGRWLLDTELYQAELCDFKMALNGFDLAPGDVISIYDEDYANQVGAGKIASYTPGSTTVILDRAVHVTTGSTITAMLADGKTLETKPIIGSGDLSSVTVGSAFSTALFTQADFAITSNIAPRPFRVVNVHVPTPGEVAVQAVFYDANKYARVEGGVVVPGSQFSNGVKTLIKSPTDLNISVEGRIVTATGLPRRFIRLNWTPPASGATPAGYNVVWSRSSSNPQSVQADYPTAEIPADEDGIYNISVVSRDFIGNVSAAPLIGTKTVSSFDQISDAGFSPVVNLVATDSNGTTWSSDDLHVVWSDNPANSRAAVGYRVEVYSASDSLIHAENMIEKSYTYTLTQNLGNSAIGAGPRNVVKIAVYARDAAGNYTPPTIVTFSNPAPAQLTAATATGMYRAAALTWSQAPEVDVKGYYVWRGATSGFTPSLANLVYTGNSTQFMDGPLLDETDYYYKIAAYDRYNSNQTGTGLNLINCSTTSGKEPGIKGFASPPVGAAIGDVYFNTVDNNLYRYDGTVWRVVGSFYGTNTQMTAKTGMQPGDLFMNTTDGKLYRWNGTIWTPVIAEVASVAAVNITGTLTNDQLAAIDAAKVAGQLTDAQLAAIAAAKITGTLTGGQIAAHTITAANIATDTITANEIAANAITATELAANSVTAAHIVAGTITGDRITGSTITGDKLVGLTVTGDKIAANTIEATSIKANSLTALQIATNAITSDELAANSVIAGKINAGAVDANAIAASAITAGKIAANAISTTNIQAGAITAASAILADASVTTLKIGGNQVTVPVGRYIGGVGYMDGGLSRKTLIDCYITVDVPASIVITVSGLFRGAIWYGDGNSSFIDHMYHAPWGFTVYRRGWGASDDGFSYGIYNTPIASVGDGYANTAPTMGPFSATIVDTVGAGTYHYWWDGFTGFTSNGGYGYQGQTSPFYANVAIVAFAAKR
jgi:hypothetical protein